ncbi:hypothetical protein Patl1_33337 [Pistacia atlantica]|uniref:Uncharacterized protein n=1 Tax=Pistacia atlantica TaxID=434234 RepID=A0ACC0ZU86_9ROSI|nr:hypothetical protein Patl1_33337 [Pistacia atlantica]
MESFMELPMAYMGKFLTFIEVVVGINPHMHWVAIQAIKVFSKNISLEFQNRTEEVA